MFYKHFVPDGTQQGFWVRRFYKYIAPTGQIIFLMGYFSYINMMIYLQFFHTCFASEINISFKLDFWDCRAVISTLSSTALNRSLALAVSSNSTSTYLP